mmetsp:Transcript_12732/g.19093  ORF Transcript_12732/g.19093 Transcript_12732/m.19093 type:complete len:108 (+) Transcript_12732:1459-1782(+)
MVAEEEGNDLLDGVDREHEHGGDEEEADKHSLHAGHDAGYLDHSIHPFDENAALVLALGCDHDGAEEREEVVHLTGCICCDCHGAVQLHLDADGHHCAQVLDDALDH